jgi:hypothetical protein
MNCMTHTEFLCSLLRSVRAVGASATLRQVRATRPAFHDGAYHDTRAVFYVWAVDRLVAGGLSDIGVLWHPLTDDRSVQAWWTIATLRTIEAGERFVAPELALPGEPQPMDTDFLVAA